MASNILSMVKDDKTVQLFKIEGGELWYVTECGFSFPVPFEDTKGATWLPKDKAMVFMRWIKKHIAHVENALKEQVQASKPLVTTSELYLNVNSGVSLGS